MKRYTQAVQRRHEQAQLERARAATIKTRIHDPRNVTNTPGRPTHRKPPGRPKPLRLGSPRYVRDGNLITLIPHLGWAVNTVAPCTCGVQTGHVRPAGAAA